MLQRNPILGRITLEDTVLHSDPMNWAVTRYPAWVSFKDHRNESAGSSGPRRTVIRPVGTNTAYAMAFGVKCRRRSGISREFVGTTINGESAFRPPQPMRRPESLKSSGEHSATDMDRPRIPSAKRTMHETAQVRAHALVRI